MLTQQKMHEPQKAYTRVGISLKQQNMSALFKPKKIMKRIILISVFALVAIFSSNVVSAKANSTVQKNLTQISSLNFHEGDNLSDNFLRPKWVDKLRKILQTIENWAEGLGDILDTVFPMIVASGNNGYEFDVKVNLDADLEELKAKGITIGDGKINFKEDTIFFENEEDGRTICVKNGSYRIDEDKDMAKILLIVKN
jgi:hypothetical protein